MGTASEYLTLNESLQQAVCSDQSSNANYGYHANANNDYAVNITYEKESLGQTHGNIETIIRRSAEANNLMDDMHYSYDANTDRTYVIDDEAALGGLATDFESYEVYHENVIGQTYSIVRSSGTKQITYNHLNLVKQIIEGSITETYTYNVAGQLVKKHNSQSGLSTLYARDAAGLVMAVYEKNTSGSTSLLEQAIYGFGRIGTYQGSTVIYEINDHLGNVRATVSKDASGNLVEESHADYYPFGSLMPGRSSSPTAHRHGYQGQFAEKNNVTGYNDFILRNYNSQTGRWLAPDPYKQYFSPYVGMGNNPVNGTDADGGYFNTSSWKGRQMLRSVKWAAERLMRIALASPMVGSNWDRYIVPGGGASNPASLENLDIRLAIMGMPDTEMGVSTVLNKITQAVAEAKRYGYDLTSDMVAAGREINMFLEALTAQRAAEAQNERDLKGQARMVAMNVGYGMSGRGNPMDKIEKLIGQAIAQSSGDEGLLYPVSTDYPISSGYTENNRTIAELNQSRPHRAIDLATPVGTPIVSPYSGTVTTAQEFSYGQAIIIQHDYSFNGQSLSTSYSHLSQMLVNAGDTVTRGQIIGYTGNYETDPHLHFVVRLNGQKVNPIIVFPLYQ